MKKSLQVITGVVFGASLLIGGTALAADPQLPPIPAKAKDLPFVHNVEAKDLPFINDDKAQDLPHIYDLPYIHDLPYIYDLPHINSLEPADTEMGTTDLVNGEGKKPEPTKP